MLVLSRAEVGALLDLDALIDALAAAMADLSAGRASAPARVAAFVAEREGFSAAMPGYVPALGALATKLVTLFPHNAAPVPTHQALIAVFDPATGTPIALMDGTEITATRTAACSALSARLLAREDASVLAVLGTGVQARAHAVALPRVRPIREIRVAGRDAGKAAALARELRRDLDLDVEASTSFAAAIASSSISRPGPKPTDVTWAPGLSHASRTTGSVAAVVAQTMSAPRDAAANDSLASASRSRSRRSSRASAAAFPASRPATRIARIGRTRGRATA